MVRQADVVCMQGCEGWANLDGVQQSASQACQEAGGSLLKGAPEGIRGIGRPLNSPSQQAAVCQVPCPVRGQVSHGGSPHAGEGTDDLCNSSEEDETDALYSSNRTHLAGADVVE